MNPIRYIRWVDSSSYQNQSWRFPDDMDLDLEPLMVESIGYVLHESDDAVTLVMSIADNESIKSDITIPTVAILEQWEISV